jgi:CBS domain-containing protein
MSGSTALPTFKLEPGTGLAQASPSNFDRVTLDSPALRVMTDLTQMRAATTTPSTSLRQAEQIMIYQGVRMLFVVTEMPAIEGLVTTMDLHGDKPMRAVHERGAHYDDLCVADVMTEAAMLDAIDFGRMQSASVGDAVAALKRQGRNHLLVVEAATPQTPRRVRGVISRSQIERQLGSAIDITPIASSFSEIERALA